MFLLNYFINIPYDELPKTTNKRSFKRSVTIDAQDTTEYQKIETSLAGRIVKELKELSSEKAASVQFVKGFRGKLYPDLATTSSKGGLITTESLSPLKLSSYPKTFFKTGETNIDKKGLKEDHKEAEKKGTVKSVRIKL